MPTVDLRDVLTMPAHNAVLGTNYNPKFTWARVAGADYYRFYLVGSGGALLDKWYQASVICNDTTCSVEDGPALGGGIFSWYVMTWNPTGSGPWSLETKFTTTAPTVPEAKVARAAYYRLYMVKSGSTIVDTWYPATPSMCGVDTCSVASPTLSGGTYSWYVMSWNFAGSSSWSQETIF
ncbi:hypothetical protein JZU69_01850, partial [bacterium]|nr:hypothetical protein [bacterium]